MELYSMGETAPSQSKPPETRLHGHLMPYLLLTGLHQIPLLIEKIIIQTSKHIDSMTSSNHGIFSPTTLHTDFSVLNKILTEIHQQYSLLLTLYRVLDEQTRIPLHKDRITMHDSPAVIDTSDRLLSFLEETSHETPTLRPIDPRERPKSMLLDIV